MFGKCRVCEEKDKRISDLQAQIADLRLFSIPRPSNELPIVEIEANKLLEGSSDPYVIDDTAQDEIDLEANNILTGSY